MNDLFLVGFIDENKSGHVDYHNLIQSVGASLSDHPHMKGIQVWDLNEITTSSQVADITQKAVQDFKVKEVPVLIFLAMENGLGYEIKRINGIVDRDTIINTFHELLDVQVDPTDHTGNGDFPLPLDGSGQLGFMDLFNLGLKLPSWVWILLAGVSGLQLIRGKNPWIWGAGAAVGAANYINARAKIGKTRPPERIRQTPFMQNIEDAEIDHSDDTDMNIQFN